MTDARNVRDELIHRVNHGEMKPDEAEAEAKRLGYEPFARVPDPNDFDPSREAQWTLPMAVSWIVFRNMQSVREWWGDYREHCWDWHFRRWRIGFDGDTHDGWFLEQRSKPTLSLLGIASTIHEVDGEPAMQMRVSEAMDALWIALREDFFRASGIDEHTDRRIVIPPLDWHELKPVHGHGDVDEMRFSLLGTGFRDVLVPSAPIQRFWPVPTQRRLHLPQLPAFDGDGYLPLYCVVQWIATKGGTLDFDPEDVEIWRPAYEDLLAAAASERVRIVGTSASGRELVPGFQFAGCRIQYPYDEPDMDLVMGTDIYLRSYPYDDEDDWYGGLSDALMTGDRELWSRLMMEKGNVRERWPFSLVAPSQTGAPGRPSSMHLIIDELTRRAGEGQLEATLREQAEALVGWLASAHPLQARPKAKTVENQIRDRYRTMIQAPK